MGRHRSVAYELLKELGMHPRIARQFLIRLRQRGFILVEEKKAVTAEKISRQVEIIVELTKLRSGK